METVQLENPLSLADDAVGTDNLQDNAVERDKVVDGAISGPKVSTGAISRVKLDQVLIDDLDSKLENRCHGFYYRWEWFKHSPKCS